MAKKLAIPSDVQYEIQRLEGCRFALWQDLLMVEYDLITLYAQYNPAKGIVRSRQFCRQHAHVAGKKA